MHKKNGAQKMMQILFFKIPLHSPQTASFVNISNECIFPGMQPQEFSAV